MADVTALAMRPTPFFVETLQAEWDRGAAVAVIDHRLRGPELSRVLDMLAPTEIVDSVGRRTRHSSGRPTEDGDALIVATSGSTGFPKGVVLTHEAVQASADLTSRRLKIDSSDRWLCCLPVAHVGGLSVITRALLTGTAITVHDGFDPAAVTEAAHRHGVTRVSLVTRALGQVDSALFRTVLLGGAAPPQDRARNVIATYGSTETGSGVVYERKALDSVELRTDSESQLWVRSPTLLRCYRDGDDPKDADGWYPTGDAGQIVDGILSVSGRMADVIVTGGEKVWPGRIEPIIRSLPSVVEVVVVGRVHPEWGHQVTAVVEPSTVAPTLQEIKDAVRAELPDWWAPAALELVAGFPRTALGKIRRPEI
ncbi:MAG: class I adenylate-forming enzyme family protein [Acidimicrobiia bacterium]